MTDYKALPQPLIETIGGFLGGVASSLVAHPLDLLKTRLQVDRESTSQVVSSLRILRNIARDDGIISGFYRGLAPNTIGNSVSWGLYFLWYGKFKDRLQTFHGTNRELSPYDHLLASGAAGALTAVGTNPIWVIKTRILSTSSSQPGAYTSILDGTRQIFRSDGIQGFYRGLVPSLFGVSHGSVQFVVYEQLKIYRRTSKPRGQKELSALDYLVLSGLSKMFAAGATYPYQVVRSRLQTYDADKAYKSARDVVVQVWRKEGLGGFYKGLGPNLLRVLPSTGVTFLVYEKTKVYLSGASVEKVEAGDIAG